MTPCSALSRCAGQRNNPKRATLNGLYSHFHRKYLLNYLFCKRRSSHTKPFSSFTTKCSQSLTTKAQAWIQTSKTKPPLCLQYQVEMQTMLHMTKNPRVDTCFGRSDVRYFVENDDIELVHEIPILKISILLLNPL